MQASCQKSAGVPTSVVQCALLQQLSQVRAGLCCCAGSMGVVAESGCGGASSLCMSQLQPVENSPLHVPS